MDLEEEEEGSSSSSSTFHHLLVDDALFDHLGDKLLHQPRALDHQAQHLADADALLVLCWGPHIVEDLLQHRHCRLPPELAERVDNSGCCSRRPLSLGDTACSATACSLLLLFLVLFLLLLLLRLLVILLLGQESSNQPGEDEEGLVASEVDEEPIDLVSVEFIFFDERRMYIIP